MSRNHMVAWDKGHSKGSTAAKGGMGEKDAASTGDDLRFLRAKLGSKTSTGRKDERWGKSVQTGRRA